MEWENVDKRLLHDLRDGSDLDCGGGSSNEMK